MEIGPALLKFLTKAGELSGEGGRIGTAMGARGASKLAEATAESPMLAKMLGLGGAVGAGVGAKHMLFDHDEPDQDDQGGSPDMNQDELRRFMMMQRGM